MFLKLGNRGKTFFNRLDFCQAVINLGGRRGGFPGQFVIAADAVILEEQQRFGRLPNVGYMRPLFMAGA